MSIRSAGAGGEGRLPKDRWPLQPAVSKAPTFSGKIPPQNVPEKERSPQVRRVKPIGQTESLLQKSVEKLDGCLEKWHHEWTDPVELMGRMPPIDTSLTNYVAVLSSAKELIQSYNQIMRSSQAPRSKLRQVQQIRQELKQIRHTELDFVREQLDVMKNSVTSAQKAFQTAKNRFLRSKGSIQQLTEEYRTFREALATLRHVESQCNEMTAALLDIQKALPEELLPKPAKEGWLESLKTLAAPVSLSPGACELFADDQERLCKEYHDLRQAVAKDIKAMSQLLVQSAPTMTDILQGNVHFSRRLEQLQEDGKNLAPILKKPFEGKLFDRQKTEEFLDGKTSLAFILSVEENLPENASPELRENVGEAKRAACKALDGVLPKSDALYASTFAQEHAFALQAFQKEFQKQEVKLLTGLQTSGAARGARQFFLFSLVNSLIGVTNDLQAAMIGTISPPQQLEQILEYGNKHTRLVELHDIVETMELSDVVVPMPFGVASQHVKEFLLAQDSAFFDTWDSLTARFETFVKTGKSSAEFLQQKEVTDTLLEIQKSIQELFTKAATNPAIIEPFVDLRVLNDWLGSLQAADKYLMVRSTSREDSKVANAGGNRSDAYVAPTLESILKSMGGVLASYFSEQSLQNLILAQQNPFEELPPLAVTMQELIGEPIGGALSWQDVPISCVLFSNEPYYTGTVESDRFRVLRISCSYGHGEAVVTSCGIATDTVLVLQSRAHLDELWISYDNQEKLVRLAPERNSQGKIELVPLENPKELVARRALQLGAVRKLFDVGVQLEEAFGFPVDSELVIKNNIIYIVQARPIDRKEAQPTYVNAARVEQQKSAKTLQAKVVVPGEVSALVCRSKDRILVANSLEAIERNKMYNEKQHDLILVSGKKAPSALSHSVVNFSNLGVPVLYLENLAEARKLIERIGRDERVLAICMQEGTLTLWNERDTPAENLIQSGYAAHPAAISHSLTVTQPPILPGQVKLFIPPDLSTHLRTIRTAETSKVALQALHQVQAHPFVEELSKELDALEKRIVLLGEKAPPEASLVVKAAQALQAESTVAFKNLEVALSDDNAPRLEKLLKAKIIKALLIGETEAGHVSGLSHLNIREGFQAADLTLTYQEKLPQRGALVGETLLMKHAVGAAQERAWVQFLAELEKSCNSEELTQLKQLFSQLDALHLMPLWMNLIFAPLQKTAVQIDVSYVAGMFYSLMGMEPPAIPHHDIPKRLHELAKSLIQQYDAPTQKFLQSLHQQKALFAAVEKSLPAFQDLKTFPQAFEKLNKLSLEFLAPFAMGFKATSSLGQLAAIQRMLEMCQLYDTAMKTMKLSSSIEPSTKFELMKKSLPPFFNLMKTWALEVVPPDSFPAPRGGDGFRPPSPMDFLKQKIDLIEHVMNNYPWVRYRNISPQDLLLPSEGFSVEPLLFGSATDSYLLQNPRTPEDVLTAIHQNCLACTSMLSNRLISTQSLKQLSYSVAFRSFLDQIGGYFSGIAGQRVGVDLTPSEITLRYNIPLRVHSATLLLSYDETSDKANVRLQVHGHDTDGRRWHQIAVYASMMHLLGHFDLATECRESANMVEIAVNLPENGDKQSKIIDEFNRILEYSVSAMRGFYDQKVYSFEFSQSDAAAIHQRLDAFVREPDQMQFFSHYNIATLIADMMQLDKRFIPSKSVIQKLIESDSSEVVKTTLERLFYLIQRDSSAEEITQLMVRLTPHPDASVRRALIEQVLSKFTQTEKVLPTLFEVAIRLSNDRDASVRLAIVQHVFSKFIYNRPALEALSDSIIRLGYDQDASVRKAVGTMFPALFVFDSGDFLPEKIADLAIKLYNEIDNRDIMANYVRFVFPKLLDRKLAADQIKPILTKLREDGWRYFIASIYKNYGFW